MYLEMLQGGSRQLAPKFLKRYQNSLASENGMTGRLSEVLEELTLIACTQDINTRPIVKAFRYVSSTIPYLYLYIVLALEADLFFFVDPVNTNANFQLKVWHA